MKRHMLFRDIERSFSAYSSPVMLISRKLTQDKRVVTDFRHLNTTIAKNNLAYPLVDTFTALGNSKCEVLSVLESERCISFTKTVREIKELLWHYTIFWWCFIFVSEDAYETQCFPSNMAKLYKYNPQLFREYKVLLGNNG